MGRAPTAWVGTVALSDTRVLRAAWNASQFRFDLIRMAAKGKHCGNAGAAQADARQQARCAGGDDFSLCSGDRIGIQGPGPGPNAFPILNIRLCECVMH